MKKNSFIILVLIGASLLYFSCKKENNTNNGTTFTINATSFTRWVYFSFAKGDTIQISNADTSTVWDLAFQRTNIRTNSGLSGKGTGGASNSGKTGTSGYTQLIEVSDTATFLTDNLNILPGEQGLNDTLVTNPLLSNWYNYNMTTHVLTTMNIVYIIRTATNKYAKFLINSYYNPKDANIITSSGYFTFTYFYQPNGSKTLQ